MANQKLTALTENTDPLGSDLEYMVDDPAGTPASRKLYKGSNNLLPEGSMVNGEISVTVASNDITVALKTKSGGNPSATDPVSVWLNGEYRRCTASLSVTKADATNWFGSGSSELATFQTDYFVYLIWNTTPATDIMDIGFARIPYGRVYSDFSTTATAQNYLAFGNASTPTSTDNCTVIGRFAATLSAAAGHVWTVPTFTNTNLIQRPIYETGWLTWLSTQTGYSANPTIVARYKVIDETVFWTLNPSGASTGTSNATTTTHTLPFTAVSGTGLNGWSVGRGQDNGAECSPVFRVANNTNILDAYKGPGQTAWTNSGTKFVSGQGFYRIA